MKRVLLFGVAAAIAVTPLHAQRQSAPTAPIRITAIKAGRLIDPEPGTAAANQVILIMYLEYVDANSRDEIVHAVRENLLFGATTIKICVDCKPWGYSVDDMKVVINEAAKGNAKVDGHCQTTDGVQRAIDAGIYIIAHGRGLTSEQHTQMAQKGIYMASSTTSRLRGRWGWSVPPWCGSSRSTGSPSPSCDCSNKSSSPETR